MPEVRNLFTCPRGDGFQAESMAELQVHVAQEHDAVMPKAEPIEPTRQDDENLATCWVRYSEISNNRDVFIRFIPRTRIAPDAVKDTIMAQVADVDVDAKGRILGVHLSWFVDADPE